MGQELPKLGLYDPAPTNEPSIENPITTQLMNQSQLITTEVSPLGTSVGASSIGSSEPAATNAPVEDEAVQVVLGMNQKHILFSFSASSLLESFSLPHTYPLLPTSPLTPSSKLEAGATIIKA